MAISNNIKNFASFKKFADASLDHLSPELHDSLWKKGTKHHMIQGHRYYLVLKKIFELFPECPVNALDLGCYPGDIGVLLNRLSAGKTRIYGCGLNFSEDFLQQVGPYYYKMLNVELDPENPLRCDHITSKIDLPENSIDLIIACEIFEHLYNPLHFIQECSRLLSENGYMILTTDNLKYIGNILGIVRNKTVFSELQESHIFMKSEWRPHERLYLRHELDELFQMYGLEISDHFFFDNRIEKYKNLSFHSWLNQKICRLFYITPSFRPRHFCVIRKRK